MNAYLDSAVTLTGLTLTNGTGTPGYGYYAVLYGGGLVAQSTVSGDLLPRVLLRGCKVSGNSAYYGGGVACEGSGDGVIELIDSLVVGNGAGGFGGGIYGDSVVLTNTSVSGNTAPFGGGGVYAKHMSGAGCSISQNATTGGGGGGILARNVSLVDTVVEGNLADLVYGRGGGIEVPWPCFPFCPPNSLSLINVRVTDNQAADCGGIVAYPSHAVLSNLTLSGNVATGYYTGYNNGIGGMSLNTLNGVVSNSILFGNSTYSLAVQGSVSVEHSLVEGGWPGTGNIDSYPFFADALSGNYRLLQGSPCIDAGSNVAVPPDVLLDLDGRPRFIEDSLTPDTGRPGRMRPLVDMGAYEGPYFPGRHPRRK